MAAKLKSLPLPLPRPNEAIEIILKLPGESCNLNCSYCYEKRQPTKSDGFITSQLIERLSEAAGGRPLSIGLHGGEPLLIGKKRMATLLNQLASSLNIVDVKLQTNGSLLDEEWITLFGQAPLSVTIGVSHDGPGELSSNRIDYSGSFGKASSRNALQKLSDAGLEFGVVCVVSRSNIDAPQRLLQYFSSYAGLSTVNFVPCFDYSAMSRDLKGPSGAIIRKQNPANNGIPGWAISPIEFLSFLRRIWEVWREYPVFVVEPFVSIVRVLHNRRPESCDFTAEKCAHVLTIYPDGRVTTCDEFESTLSDLGVNLFTSDTRLPGKRDFQAISSRAVRHLAKCAECSHSKTCGGGCIATREQYYGSPYYEEYCTYKKRLIDFVEEQLAPH